MNGRLAATALAVCSVALAGCDWSPAYTGAVSGTQRTIEIRARRFAFTPGVVTVKQGETVVLKLVSEDVSHGFFLDGYEKMVTVPPGEVRVVGFTASKTGSFAFRCARTCGDFHPYMVGRLRVLPDRRYQVGAGLAILLGLLSLALDRRRLRNPSRRLFGLIPLDWRLDLTRYPSVRRLSKSRWFPLVLVVLNFAVFVLVLVTGLAGGFSAGNTNFAIMVVWILWWVLLMTVFVPFAGRLWCMVCPFPLIGDWLQRGKLVAVGRHRSWGLNRKWPKQLRNLWPVTATFTFATLFLGFFTVKPFATFALLALMLLGATVMAVIYEKRTFCLYACPVSGFQGLYANWAACEVRVRDLEICRRHVPKTCYVGDAKGYGCPWMELPWDMNRNTYCGMCLECFKSCPYDNMVVNIRPFGTDLLAERRRTDDIQHRRGLDEAFKSLTMIGVLFAFFLTMQGPYGWIKDLARASTLGGYARFVTGYLTLNFLLVPGVFLLVAYLSRLVSGNREISLRRVFVDFSYCLVPLGVARWAAFSLGVLLPNASYLPRVTTDPLALGWNLFGAAAVPWMPLFTGALPYLQLGMVLVGLAFSLEYGRRFAGQIFPTHEQAARGWIPMLLFLTALAVFFTRLFEG